AAILSIVGLTYGAIIAVYPYAINRQFGDFDGPRIYGRVFTAWGISGLAGPWLAGTLYDHTGSYSLPLVVAAAAAMLSAMVVIFSSIARIPAIQR
ncbi:MAG: YbfB/YjiJ family MFS transporter, partial [bacterium]